MADIIVPDAAVPVDLSARPPSPPPTAGILGELSLTGGTPAAVAAQPYRYERRPLVEPDWRRIPGWRDVSAADWNRAQWQRAHCVKTPAQLRAVLGDLVDESFYADLDRDRAER